MATSKISTLYTSSTPLPSTGNRSATRGGGVARNKRTARFMLRSTATVKVDGQTVVPTYVFEINPNELRNQRLAIGYQELERPGRKPLLQSKSHQLQQLSGDFLIVSRSAPYVDHCQQELDALVAFSRIDEDFTIVYKGVPADYLWRITDLEIRVARRRTDDRILLAEASITFTESSFHKDTIVPGMAVIKDSSISTRGDSAGATTELERSQADRDAETKRMVQAVIDAGVLET